MKLTIEGITATAMRELAETHRAYKAFLSADEPSNAAAAERKQQHLYAQYCAARDRVVVLAEQLFPSGRLAQEEVVKLTVDSFILDALRELAEAHHDVRALYRRGSEVDGSVEGERVAAAAYARHEKASSRLETIAVGLFPRPRKPSHDVERARKQLLKAARRVLELTGGVPS